MECPYIYMHGPEHHVMVGAALLTAWHNGGGQIDFPAALEEMKKRGSQIPGGICGLWGTCGAAVSAGIFFSIVTSSSPMSSKTWGLGNQLTSRCLDAIGSLGGPRCCKRDSFTAVSVSIDFIQEHSGHIFGKAGTDLLHVFFSKRAVYPPAMPLSCRWLPAYGNQL